VSSHRIRLALAILTLVVPLLVAPVRPQVAYAAGPYPDGALGYDISFPQGTGPYPSPPFSIAIVGVNNGQPFGRNPHLQQQWAWAQQANAEPAVYINTDYHHSVTDSFGDTGPKGTCNGDESCRAYNYGWNAAADALKNAKQFGVTAKIWWLDVETGNWWPCDSSGNNCDTWRDALDIQGGLDYLRSQALTAGVYSTSRQWGIITGGYGLAAPLWVPDFDDNQPAGYCNAAHGFGGSTVFMVQYTAGSYDGDYSCPAQHGYYLVAGDGGIFPFGDATGYGSTGNVRLNKPVVGMATTPKADGYWVVAGDGGIFTFGNAIGYGSTGGIHLNKPVVAMVPTATGKGYWLVASDGGIFPFGDAAGYGSTGGIVLNKPIIGMAVTATGKGYWLVAGDGGIFPFGDATGYGSTGGIVLNKPIVSMAATVDGKGYWLVAADGGVFSFGDAVGYGSAAALPIDSPVVSMAHTLSGKGYWMATQKGAVIAFGDALGQDYGSMSGRTLNQPALQLAPTP
jgi:hypothetical protein